MLNIPARIYSKAVWETIYYRTQEYQDYFHFDTKNRPSATISEYTANMLRRIAFFFKPKMVAEVGTYIGRSTVALADGMKEGEIHTCDSEEKLCDLINWEGTDIIKYYDISTRMFEKLKNPVDMFFFDGRIQPADLEHIQRLATPECVFLFDDFEGIEKGVANALMIQHLGGILVLPEEGQTLGMMLKSKIGLTRQ